MDEKYYLSDEQVEKIRHPRKWKNSIKQIDRTYPVDGLAPTLNTMQGGGKVPKIVSMTNVIHERHGRRGDVISENGLHPTLTATDYKTPPRIAVNNNQFYEGYSIRTITPKEAWRLQGFSDEQFEKAKTAGISNTQLYKQAGNSVTVSVFEWVGSLLKEN